MQPIKIPGTITIVLHFRRIEPMMIIQQQPSNRMPAEFNYVLVSDEDIGMQFTNICNQELNFQEGEPYEVCMQDMLFAFSAWNNVREGANIITVRRNGSGGMSDAILRVPPGRYTSKKKLVDEINKLLITLRPGYPNHERKSNYPELVWFPAVATVPQKRFRHWSAGGAEASICGGDMLGDEEQPPKPAIPEYIELRNQQGYPIPAEERKKAEKELEKQKVNKNSPFINLDLPIHLRKTYSDYYTNLAIQWYQFEFCNELAIMLGMTSYISPLSASDITYGWKTNTSNIDLERNTVPMLWVFADFVHKIMFGRQMFPLLRLVACKARPILWNMACLHCNTMYL